VLRDDLGNVLAVVDVISQPQAIAWTPPDKTIVGVIKEQIAKHWKQTLADIPKRPSDVPWWVWLAGAGVLAWYTRPIIANLTRGKRK
jgi:hypothetical protein